MTNTFKSIGTVVTGFLTIAILSIVTDLIVEGVGLLPPATQPEAYLWWHLAIALFYRSVYAVVGGYLTAKLAPSKRMTHVIALAVIGTIIGTLGTIANWDKAVMSGVWYPVVLLITSPLFVWWGGTMKK